MMQISLAPVALIKRGDDEFLSLLSDDIFMVSSPHRINGDTAADDFLSLISDEIFMELGPNNNVAGSSGDPNGNQGPISSSNSRELGKSLGNASKVVAGELLLANDSPTVDADLSLALNEHVYPDNQGGQLHALSWDLDRGFL